MKLHLTTRSEKFWRTVKKLNCQRTKHNLELRQKNFTLLIIVSSQIPQQTSLLWSTDQDVSADVNQEDAHIDRDKDVVDIAEVVVVLLALDFVGSKTKTDATCVSQRNQTQNRERRD